MALEERDFDIIVVGAGCAGASAAYVTAKLGKNVLVIERGESARRNAIWCLCADN